LFKRSVTITRYELEGIETEMCSSETFILNFTRTHQLCSRAFQENTCIALMLVVQPVFPERFILATSLTVTIQGNCLYQATKCTLLQQSQAV